MPAPITFRLFAIHIFSGTTYQRTITELMAERNAQRFCETYNEIHGGAGEQAIRQLVLVDVQPPMTLSQSA